MELGDSLTDAAKYVYWQRGQAMNAKHKEISEEEAGLGPLPKIVPFDSVRSLRISSSSIFMLKVTFKRDW